MTSENLTRAGYMAIDQETIELRFRTVGYSPMDQLRVNVGPSKSGEIVDGITFEHDQEGGWVLSFDDLETIYQTAKSVRGKR